MLLGGGASERIVRRSIGGSAKIRRSDNVGRVGDANVQMYLEPPTEDISIVEFEELAVARLRVLRAVDDLKERFPRSSDEMNDALAKQLMKLMPIACGVCPPDRILEERRRDRISHFILRLAFCKSPDQRKWFVQQEVDLFKFRFQTELKSRTMLARFLEANNFNIDSVSQAEKDDLAEELSNAIAVSTQKARCMEVWKVRFTEALDLIRKRRVLLRAGFAYLSQDDLVVIIATRFQININAAMARACKYIAFIEEGDRLMPLLNRLTNKTYLGKEYDGKQTSSVTPDMIDALAVRSFPLCMRNIHNRLRAEHHVRHGARMQYGLFLKAIGMSVEHSLAFWRTEFTKKMPLEKFDKEYAYNIRHNYGKEGRHADYPAYSCAKIILGNPPAPQDCHGCPFRHSDPQILQQRLESSGLSSSQVNSIVSLSKSSRFDQACTRYFEFTHRMPENSLSSLITHPNEYFELSKQISEGKVTSESLATTEVVLESQAPSTSKASTASEAFDEEMDFEELDDF